MDEVTIATAVLRSSKFFPDAAMRWGERRGVAFRPRVLCSGRAAV
jgi:hypothetical protein